MITLSLALAAPQLQTFEVGADRGHGNVLGVQMWVEPRDYRSPEALTERLGSWLEQADGRGWIGSNTVVVLPEHAGTWLVAAHEREAVVRAGSADKAMRKVVFANLWRFLGAKSKAPATDPSTYAVFSMKSEQVAADYQSVLGGLAKRFGVTVVGGSILLPEPALVDGSIVVSPGAPLRNSAFVFGPEGQVIGGPVVKVFPTVDELDFTTAGEAAGLGPVQTPAGSVGVLVCADGWFPEAHAALGEVDLLVVPQYTSVTGLWTQPWGGYSGYPEPADVDLEDIGRISESEAWLKYGPTARSEASMVMTVPLRGALWDLGADAQARGVLEGELWEGPLVDAPVLLNMWRTR